MKIKYKTPEEKWLDSIGQKNMTFVLYSSIPVRTIKKEIKTNDKRMLKLIKKRYKKVEIEEGYVYYEN